MPTNTEKLLATEPDAYERATRHPFLTAVGRGVIDRSDFGQWMRQDRLYIQLGFARFAGALLAKNPVPSDLHPESKSNRQFRARLAILSNAVQNADSELARFESVAETHRVELGFEAPEKQAATEQISPLTRAYIDYMNAIAASHSFEEGFVLLWSMEKLYNAAWTYASGLDGAPEGHRSSFDPLISVWASPEFVQFVRTLTELVDEFEFTSESWARVLQVWHTVLWFEERFWDSHHHQR